MELLDNEILLALMKKSGGGGSTDPVIVNKEAVVTDNNVNSLSASFTAQNTSAYMIIAVACCDSYTLPNINSCSITVKGQSYGNIYEYYKTEEYGMDSKYAVVELTEGDTVAVSMTTDSEEYGTSCMIALVKLSNKIGDFSLIIDDFDAGQASEVSYNLENSGLYLLFFFDRHEGVGSFNKLKVNGSTIIQNIVICADNNVGWQVSHGLCIIAGNAADAVNVKTEDNGVFNACGIMSLKKK